MDIPPDKVIGRVAKLYVVWKVKALLPVYNLAVCVVAVLGAKWGPSDKTLVHDGAKGPPLPHCELASYPLSNKA